MNIRCGILKHSKQHYRFIEIFQTLPIDGLPRKRGCANGIWPGPGGSIPSPLQDYGERSALQYTFTLKYVSFQPLSFQLQNLRFLDS